MKNSGEEEESTSSHKNVGLVTPTVSLEVPPSSSNSSPNTISASTLPAPKRESATKQHETNDNKQTIKTSSDLQQQHRLVALKAPNIQENQEQVINNNATQFKTTATTTTGNKKQPPPQRQPRPIRPNLRRQVIVTGETSSSVPVMTARPIELASILPVGTSAALVTPPKRPAHLPARYAIHHPSPISAASASGSSKPNRYAWAQVQQWQAAAAAAAAAHQQQVAVLAQQQDPTNLSSNVHPNNTIGPHNRFQQHFSSAASRVLVVNPMHIVNISKHTKSRLIKSIEAVKRFSEKWFSHVLLLLFLAVYACFGAYIFISFEAPTEFWEKQLIIDTRLRIVNESWYEAHDKSQQDFLDLFRTKFEDYERILNRACASGMTSSSMENQWTFWGALFYSMTVFTTIGYGHLTPITFAGRVATMVYAIFGIPILLMVLADLGKLLTRIIKYAFKKFRYLYNKVFKKSKTSQRTRKLIQENTNQYLGVARGAIERGMATYIQPNYNKIPKAATLLREKLTWRSTATATAASTSNTMNNKQIINNDSSENDINHSNGNNDLSEEKEQTILPNTIGELDLTEKNYSNLNNDDAVEEKCGIKNSSSSTIIAVTSDVIVTPNKQSKPVSPQPGDSKTLADHSPTGAAHNHGHHHHGHHNTHNNHNNHSNHHQHQHQHQQHHSGENNKSKGTAERGWTKRKTSTSIFNSNMRHQKAPTNQPKSSLSRSSSSSMLGTITTSSTVNGQPQTKLGTCDLEAKQEQKSTTSKVGEIDNIGQTQNSHEQQQQQDDDDQLKQAPIPSEQFVYDDEEGGVIVQDDGELIDDDDQEEEEDFDIPVSFAVFLLIVYMMFGAVIFSIWEGWNFFDSLYFVFISMSTIGFGDLVPQHPKRMIGTFIYLLFGLALTSMCINVVQEKIHATFLRAKMQIGEKMGFDLDQIMADDYYGSVDGGAGVGGGTCGGCSDPECDSHSNEISQTNSSYGVNNNHADTNYKDDDILNNNDLNNHLIDDSNNVVLPTVPNNGGVKLSKSKESLKIKKRNIASLPGHNSINNNNNNINSSSSFRRKSSKRQPLSRQLTPATNMASQNIHNNNGEKDNQPTTTTTTTNGIGLLNISKQIDGDILQQTTLNARDKDTMKPIKSELEIIEKKTTISSSTDNNNYQDRLTSTQPGINVPTNYSIKGICQPLLAKKMPTTSSQGGSVIKPPVGLEENNHASETMTSKQHQHNIINNSSRPLFTQTINRQQQQQQQSQPIVKSLSSEGQILNNMTSTPYSCDSSTTAASFRLNMLANSNSSNNNNNNNNINNNNLNPYKTNRSASSSRRSSVSHELNQLDDLISVLKSQSKQVEKFGPLLGIPSTKGLGVKAISRSSSSHNSNDKSLYFTSDNNSSNLKNNNYYQTSNNNLTYRRGTSMTNRPTYTQQQQQQKQTPVDNNNQSFDTIDQTRYFINSPRPSSSTRISSNKDMVNDNAQSTVINLSTSQKALAELEEIKFSAL